jgi:hypothetical protein
VTSTGVGLLCCTVPLRAQWLDSALLGDLLQLDGGRTLGLALAALMNGDLVLGALLFKKVLQIPLQVRLARWGALLRLCLHGKASSAPSTHLKDFL